MSLPHWPYQDGPITGAWGKPNSNANFCEEDYIITPYIAEFVNTLTNLTYIIYGAHGIRNVAPKKDGGVFSTLAFPYWGLIGVGVLSGWFHATMKYYSQWGDDLSMFLAVGAVMHQLLMADASPSQRRNITVLVVGTLVLISIYHCWADEIIVHQIAFASMIFITGKKIRQLIRERVKSAESRRKLVNMANWGLGSGLFGFFLWNIDVHLCSHVTAIKRSIGLPWGFLLELHGWWHILTGIGAYVGMALVEFLLTAEDGKTDRIEQGFVWPVKAVLRDLKGAEGVKKGR